MTRTTATPDADTFADAGHSHVFLGAHHDAATRRTLRVVALTTVAMIGEIVAGTLFNSMALLADGFHMATHAGALAVAAGAYVFARNHATDPRFSFGTGKVGDLAGFASALVLGLAALGIGVESLLRLFDPRPVAFGEATLIAVAGLIVNVASAVLLAGGHGHHHAADHGHDRAHGHEHGHDHGHGHGHGPAHHHDNNFRSAYVHVLADALTSVLAIAALLGGRFFGWVWLDPAMGLVGAFVIAAWSRSLLRDTARVLLDVTDRHVAAEIRACIEGPGDARIADLHLWRVGPDAHAAIVGVVGLDRDDVRRRLAPVHEIAHLTVEAIPHARPLATV